jgi:hypothetical protein
VVVKGFVKLCVENRKIVVLTFELFWIAVFLLAAAGGTGGADAAQFVYANF